MTAENFVKNKLPHAKAEKHKNGLKNKTYWIIRNGNQNFYFALGNSESNAWVNAKKNIINKKPIMFLTMFTNNN